VGYQIPVSFLLCFLFTPSNSFTSDVVFSLRDSKHKSRALRNWVVGTGHKCCNIIVITSFWGYFLGPSRFWVDLIVIFYSACVGLESCGGAENCKGASSTGWSGGLGNTLVTRQKNWWVSSYLELEVLEPSCSSFQPWITTGGPRSPRSQGIKSCEECK
jgi:hypothetical protein